MSGFGVKVRHCRSLITVVILHTLSFRNMLRTSFAQCEKEKIQ
jgi:hypothetical protein